MGCNSSTAGAGSSPSTRPSGKGKVVLAYLNCRGTSPGTVARYLLAHSGANWEEKTYIMGTPELGNYKKTGEMPFCNVPYVIDGDVKLSETHAVH